ncbi:MAG: hypothetical protein NZ928_03100 [Endomicrobia bacterium]|nr:hypothetical protein [Endomicrobiia bacterium]MDW8055549.1 hypothetical protein [Elusimicrobiota bacterium]
MKKIFTYLFIFYFSLITNCFCETQLPQEIIDLGLNFIENPGDLFFNLQQNIEDCSPLPAGQITGLKNKYFGFGFNLFPTLLPTTLGNISFKIRFNKERNYIPQIGAIFGFGRILALNLIPSKNENGDEIPKPENNVYYYGLVLSKTFENTVLYLGVKHSEFLLKVKFAEEFEFYGSILNEFNFRINDTFLFTGIMLPTEKKKLIVAQMGYGLKYKKIVARLGAEYSHLRLGLDIFPEGLLVFHPYIAYKWEF